MYILEEEADVKEQAFAPGPGKNTKKKGGIVISVLHKSIDLKWQLGDKESTASGRVF
jgi:hypothetical protein